MERVSREQFQELAENTGEGGVPRLVALLKKKHAATGDAFPDAALNRVAREILDEKPEKQVLRFPMSHSGGAVHASSPNEVWQADSASMTSYGHSASGIS